jgi:hypothetical protein
MVREDFILKNLKVSVEAMYPVLSVQRAYLFMALRDMTSAATRLNLIGPLEAAVLQVRFLNWLGVELGLRVRIELRVELAVEIRISVPQNGNPRTDYTRARFSSIWV